MKFLENQGFNEEEIRILDENIPERIKKVIVENYKTVAFNLAYLRELGVTRYKDVFSKFYDMFLLDYGTFKDIFDKYETSSLIEKIEQNINIVEYL